MIYWTVKSIPELAALPTHERRELLRKTLWKAWLHWQTWAALAVSWLLPYSGGIVAFKVLGPMVPPSALFAPHGPLIILAIIWLPALLLGAVGCLIFDQTFKRMLRRHLPDVVPTRCRACGYDLRATPDRCPECGQVPEKAVT